MRLALLMSARPLFLPSRSTPRAAAPSSILKRVIFAWSLDSILLLFFSRVIIRWEGKGGGGGGGGVFLLSSSEIRRGLNFVKKWKIIKRGNN